MYKKIHYLIVDLDLGIKVTRNVAQYPLHHVTYLTTKFKVATFNGLGGDTFTRNVMDGRQTDFSTKLIYPFWGRMLASGLNFNTYSFSVTSIFHPCQVIH